MRRILPRPLGSIALTLLVASLGGSPAARAEEQAPPAVSPAKQLFADARKLVGEGKYADACPKFEESLRLELGVGTQFNLADCWEHIGRTASAHALFLGAAASAKASGQTEREQVLRERATALEPRLARLVIEVAAADPKLRVKRGELPLDSEAWGKAVAVDPGKYTITARAPGKQAWEKLVEVTGATPIVTVEIPELQPLPEEKPAPAKPAPKVKATPPAATTDDRHGSVNYRAIAVAGVGVGALAVGTVMGLKFRSANKDAKAICPTSRDCSVKQIQDHDRLVDEAKTARRWTYAGFGVGGFALLGAGALWYFQRPKATTAAVSTWHAAPEIAADGSVGATLSGTF